MRRSVADQQIELLHAVRSADIAPPDAQDLMPWPFVSLVETPCGRPIDFRMGDATIPVEAHEHGMATICDADALIWAASQTVDARERGLRTSRRMAATLHEILAFIRRREGRPINNRPPQTLGGLPALRSSSIPQSRHAVMQRFRKNMFASRPGCAERWVKARVTDKRSRRKPGLFPARLTIDVNPDLRGRIGITVADMLLDLLPKTSLRSKRSRP
jgi:plasmid replication initiation protein